MKYIRYCFGLSILLSLFLASCSNDSKKATAAKEFTADRPIRITCTTGILKDALETITGGKAQIEALMGAGVDPHLYKATQGDLKKLNRGDVIVYHGLHLEGKMTEIMEKLSKKKRVINVAEGIRGEQIIRPANFPETGDPHLWHDVSLWSEAIAHISAQLQEIDSKNKDIYKERTGNYLKSLEILHDWTTDHLSSIPKEHRVLITSHDAFEYFGRAYNMEVRGLQGLSTLSEYGLKDIADMVDFIVERKIKAVFVETSVPIRSLEAVIEGCRERDHEVVIGGTLFSDALGPEGTRGGTYTSMIKLNVLTIKEALK